MKRIIRRAAAAILSLTLLVTSASALSVEEALELLDSAFLQEIPDPAREAQTLDELFSLLGDPYTYYMSEEEYREFLGDLEGVTAVVGIGISAQLTDEGILVSEVIPGGSADASGLNVGDLIVAIDGTPCVPATMEHHSMIGGEAGTFLTLTVLRDGQSMTFTLPRVQVSIPNIQFTLLDGNVGYIDCNSFGMDTGNDVAAAVRRYDYEADTWLLDLRGNTGGYTTAAVEALGSFVGPGYLLFLRGKTGYTEAYSHGDLAVNDEPLIVLVDGSSASASEAVAAGLRDLGRGLVIGTRTFGKGVAQALLDEAGYPELFSGDALKMTVYRFYSVGGNTTDRIGVIPALLVDEKSTLAIAQSLCGSFREDYVTEGQLMLHIAGQYFFIDRDTLAPETTSALLSALPPSATLYLGVDTYTWDTVTPADAAHILGVEYINRYFTDVAGSPYADEINTLATYELLLGDGSGQFDPKGRLTRAEACAMLAQLMGLTYTGPSQFTDVADSAWYADEVNAMAALGFVKGTGDGRFQPNAVLSQQEFFAILGRMARHLNLTADNYAASFYRPDGTCLLDYNPSLTAFPRWAKEGVAVLAWSFGALSNDGSMLFTELDQLNPAAPILREEAAACIYRMLHIMGILSV